MFRHSAFLPLVLLAAAMPAVAAPPHDDDDDDARARPETEVVVTARRLDVARESVEPGLGASTYTLSNDAVENRPAGETTSLGRVMLQMPGVAQDGLGRLLVRGAPGALQFRINNVIIPEGVADFGERLSARLADRTELITGALPAQYGLQVGGVVNVVTKSGTYAEGGQAELYGGSHRELEPAFEYAGASGPTSLFVSGSYLRSDVGLSAPDASARPLHDATRQIEGFAYADHVLDAQSRLSLILGTSNEDFQVPALRGLNAATFRGGASFQRPLVVNGVSAFASDAMKGSLAEDSHYGILSYLRTSGPATLQASLFARLSRRELRPDELGSLLFGGIARHVSDRDFASGAQIEGVYKLGETHSLRGGVILGWTRARGDVRTLVLPVDAQGRQVSDVPMVDTARAVTHRAQASAFVQDEWTPLAPLTINAGLRLDHVGGTGGGTALGPRASIVWTGPAGVKAHAGYARYFVPAPQERGPVRTFAGTTGALPGIVGAPLRAETDDYWDVGVQKAGGGLTVGLDFYWREARNLVGRRDIGAVGTEQVFNYGKGRLRGAELSLTYSKGPFSAWSNVALGEARAKTIVSHQYYFSPTQLARIAANFVPTEGDQKVTASGGASWRFGALRVSGDLLYGSGFAREAGGRLPGWVQADFAAVYRLDGLRDRPLDLRLDLINAFDRAYQLRDGSLGHGELPQWGPRRGIFVGLEQAF